MRNEHGVEIIPAAEDLRRAERMLEREKRSGPHPGKTRVMSALEARIRILKERTRGEAE